MVGSLGRRTIGTVWRTYSTKAPCNNGAESLLSVKLSVAFALEALLLQALTPFSAMDGFLPSSFVQARVIPYSGHI